MTLHPDIAGTARVIAAIRAELVARDRAAQRLPERVTDPTVLRSVAALVCAKRTAASHSGRPDLEVRRRAPNVAAPAEV